MILYPTETIYALGVNAFDNEAVQRLQDFKGRAADKYTSVLVRDIVDIERWAILSNTARQIANTFLPGPLTLVLPVQAWLTYNIIPADRSLGFRISPDPTAQQTIADFMATHDAPLTCTSANVSGEVPGAQPSDIVRQFRTHGRDTAFITQIVEAGVRQGSASTVVRVEHSTVTFHRIGAIPEAEIIEVATQAT